MKSSTSANFGWLLTLRLPPVPTGKQQRSRWLSDPVFFEFSYTYPDGFSQGYASEVHHLQNLGKQFECSLLLFPGKNSCVIANPSGFVWTSRVDLSFQANLSHLSPLCSLWLSVTKGWVSELCGPLGIYGANNTHCAWKLTFACTTIKFLGWICLSVLKSSAERDCLTDGVEQEGNKESKMSHSPLLLKVRP